MTKRILLVDDSGTVIQFERMLLRELGCEIATAENGKRALEKIAEHKPDLVLLDLAMPEMDGMETLRHLKQNPETKDIPVIVVTTKGDPESVQKAFEAGCFDFISKPFDRVELLIKVKGCLT
jgi:CheY-like chemotaxis protein